MPVLVIPFITLAFYALGGGSAVQASATEHKDGLNMKVPDARLKTDETDKLGFYLQADKDSSKMKEWIKSDPYYKANELSAVDDNAGTAGLPLSCNPPVLLHRKMNY